MNKAEVNFDVPGPRFMYGTAWKEEATKACVLAALTAGFRSIDTANQRKHYHEAGVGEALLQIYESGELTREDLFLQTKFTYMQGQDHRLPYDKGADLATQVQQSFESSLEHLRTDYLDSYVLHGPWLGSGLAEQDLEVWRQMEAIHATGAIRVLGVSNVNLLQLQELYETVSLKPTFVQNRCFAVTGWDQTVRSFCLEKGIVYQGFSLLTANREATSQPAFLEIANRLRATPAQLVFAFALAVGMLPLTGTTDPDHMREDLDCTKFELTDDDITTIESVVMK